MDRHSGQPAAPRQTACLGASGQLDSQRATGQPARTMDRHSGQPAGTMDSQPALWTGTLDSQRALWTASRTLDSQPLHYGQPGTMDSQPGTLDSHRQPASRQLWTAIDSQPAGNSGQPDSQPALWSGQTMDSYTLRFVCFTNT